jgi:hypothetical protein
MRIEEPLVFVISKPSKEPAVLICGCLSFLLKKT